MDLAIATARLQRMTASATPPVLSSDDLTLLLDEFAIVDSNGRLPTDVDWDGAWNLNKAAAEGWRTKAGRISDRFNFGSDVNSFQREQAYKHCIEMSEMYNKRGISYSLEVGAKRDIEPVIGNLNGL